MNDDNSHHESLFETIIHLILWYYFLQFLGLLIIGICYLLWKGVIAIGELVAATWKQIIIPLLKLFLKGLAWSYTFIIISERKLLRLKLED